MTLDTAGDNDEGHQHHQQEQQHRGVVRRALHPSQCDMFVSGSSALRPFGPLLGHDPLILKSCRIDSRPWTNPILAFSLVNSAAACLPARSLVLFCAYGPQAPWSSILVDLSSIT